LPPVVAWITAPVYLVLVTKVPKHGPIIILGILMACTMFITGMYWMWPIAYIVFSIVADIISGIKNFRSMKLNILGDIIFSFNLLITYSMLWINQKEYIEYLVSKGTDKAYMDIMVLTAQNWMLSAMMIPTLISAFIGAMLGKKLLEKQFEKAGIV
jgi:energy-coupling factor transport system substrate-specific component